MDANLRSLPANQLKVAPTHDVSGPETDKTASKDHLTVSELEPNSAFKLPRCNFTREVGEMPCKDYDDNVTCKTSECDIQATDGQTSIPALKTLLSVQENGSPEEVPPPSAILSERRSHSSKSRLDTTEGRPSTMHANGLFSAAARDLTMAKDIFQLACKALGETVARRSMSQEQSKESLRPNAPLAHRAK